jgi:hypothetical protein
MLKEEIENKSIYKKNLKKQSQSMLTFKIRNSNHEIKTNLIERRKTTKKNS